MLSGMAAYGAHPDNPVHLTEEDFPGGDPLDCYRYAKAELEHCLQWLTRRNPGLEVTILRPTIIAGANIDNLISWLFSRKLGASLLEHDSLAQQISEEDLASAIRLVLHHRARGTHNIISYDCMPVSEILKRAGMIRLPLPVSLVCWMMDLLFKIGLSRISSHWVRQFLYPMVGTSDKLKEELGRKPINTTEELLEEILRAVRSRYFATESHGSAPPPAI
ncbi:MAG: NAD-dependent epimerase/dehydratase family protein [Actinomycetota bacterium]|nr:NAD-dependent epimerase/dehydratase family protein [Actinomycetota bacterium]